MLKKYVFIPCSFLVLDVCNQGKTLCSPCILEYSEVNLRLQNVKWVLWITIWRNWLRIFCSGDILCRRFQALFSPVTVFVN